MGQNCLIFFGIFYYSIPSLCRIWGGSVNAEFSLECRNLGRNPLNWSVTVGFTLSKGSIWWPVTMYSWRGDIERWVSVNLLDNDQWWSQPGSDSATQVKQLFSKQCILVSYTGGRIKNKAYLEAQKGKKIISLPFRMTAILFACYDTFLFRAHSSLSIHFTFLEGVCFWHFTLFFSFHLSFFFFFWVDSSMLLIKHLNSCCLNC